jgi:hypothetical protein
MHLLLSVGRPKHPLFKSEQKKLGALADTGGGDHSTAMAASVAGRAKARPLKKALIVSFFAGWRHVPGVVLPVGWDDCLMMMYVLVSLAVVVIVMYVGSHGTENCDKPTFTTWWWFCKNHPSYCCCCCDHDWSTMQSMPNLLSSSKKAAPPPEPKQSGPCQTSIVLVIAVLLLLLRLLRLPSRCRRHAPGTAHAIYYLLFRSSTVVE